MQLDHASLVRQPLHSTGLMGLGTEEVEEGKLQIHSQGLEHAQKNIIISTDQNVLYNNKSKLLN
jgi:hypothetical protein